MSAAFFDIDTQIDFLLPAGALYVSGAEHLMPALDRLNHYAAANGFPVVSSMCAHVENDPEFHDWPAHCVTGTVGQLKPASTLLEKRALPALRLEPPAPACPQERYPADACRWQRKRQAVIIAVND